MHRRAPAAAPAHSGTAPGVSLLNSLSVGATAWLMSATTSPSPFGPRGSMALTRAARVGPALPPALLPEAPGPSTGPAGAEPAAVGCGQCGHVQAPPPHDGSLTTTTIPHMKGGRL